MATKKAEKAADKGRTLHRIQPVDGAAVDLTYRIEGKVPLLMHNVRLSNPRDPIVREIKKITKKKQGRTDADDDRLEWLEWQGGLYLDESGRVVVTSDMVEGMLVGGAKKTKKGQDARCGIEAVCVDGFPLTHKGPKDLESLYANEEFRDRRSVVVQRNRVLRTRPRFFPWSLEFTVRVETDVASPRDIDEWLVAAGRLVGLGDGRPKFGRFVVLPPKP